MEAELTERQAYWLAHVQACDTTGQSTFAYAKAHGLQPRAMYKARQVLIEKGVWSNDKLARKHNHFQRVQVQKTAGGAWQIQLPNGVMVSFSGDVNAKALSTVLKTAAALS